MALDSKVEQQYRAWLNDTGIDSATKAELLSLEG
ncbi:MAG: hypothetical protein K0Q90_702, partial [Paenibacillaceae bacterium]|nr:hypothetical protein [Paenibacillaceae bacterium]